MAKNKKYTVKFKRRRKNKTDYNKRLSYLKSEKLRLVIRPKNSNIILQIIKYDPKGDRVVVHAHSKEIQKLGWMANKGNIPSSYLTGFLLGKKAQENNIKEAILDTGQHSPIPKSRVYAALKGVIDAGIYVPHSKEVLPDENTLSGQKIANYARQIRNNPVIFSNYKRSGTNPESIQDYFKEIKAKIAAFRSVKK